MGKQFVVKNQSKVAYSNRKSPVSVALTSKCRSGNMKLTLLKFMVLQYSSSYCLWYCCYCRRRESFFTATIWNCIQLHQLIEWAKKNVRVCGRIAGSCRFLGFRLLSHSYSHVLTANWNNRFSVMAFESLCLHGYVCVYKYHCMCIGTAERFFGIVSSNCHFCNI